MDAKNKICLRICMGSSCFSRGNNKTLASIQEYIADNNLDEQIELMGSLCEGQCSSGPHIIVNDRKYDNITPETAIDILCEEVKAKGIRDNR